MLNCPAVLHLSYPTGLELTHLDAVYLHVIPGCWSVGLGFYPAVFHYLNFIFDIFRFLFTMVRWICTVLWIYLQRTSSQPTNHRQWDEIMSILLLMFCCFGLIIF